MRVVLAFVLTGCVVANHPPPDPRAYLDRAQREAQAGHPTIALGALFALHAPQLAAAPIPDAYLLEARIYAEQCYFARAYALITKLRREVPLTDAQAAEASEIMRRTGVAWMDVWDNGDRPIDVGDVIVDDEHYVFPFDGTFWTDELDSYRVALRSTCYRR